MKSFFKKVRIINALLYKILLTTDKYNIIMYKFSLTGHLAPNAKVRLIPEEISLGMYANNKHQ